MHETKGPLAGLRILEMQGIGPGPFCGMLLADLGADVVRVERGEVGGVRTGPDSQKVLHRGKRSISLDLKSAADVEVLLGLIEHADALIEGMRPGVMERLGLGPDVCLARNPRLAYGRMTGWGQTGPLAQAAGHDLNYIGLSGALWYAGQPDQAPLPPPSLIGDIGGGALYLALGLLAGIFHARATGQGQVVDAAIVDGSANMMNLLMSLMSAGKMNTGRGLSPLDGSHWYQSYRCADGRFVTVGAVEPKFYQLLLHKLGLENDPAFSNQRDATQWQTLGERMAALFATRTQSQWCELLEGTDACFSPVLSPQEAAEHPHMKARDVYTRIDGALQASPAPRFSETPGRIGAMPQGAERAELVLRQWAGG